MRRWLTGCFALVLLAGEADASPGYPGEIMRYLETNGSKVIPVCPPPCTLCHTSPYGGELFLRSSGFLPTIQAEGRVGKNQPISALLKTLESGPCAASGMPEPCNTDRLGKPDIAELRDGTDPQSDDPLGECPQYGCGATLAPVGRRNTHLGGAATIGVLGVLLLFSRKSSTSYCRRRSGSRPPTRNRHR